MADAICGYAGAAVLIAVTEKEGEFGLDTAETLADIRGIYGALLGALVGGQLILAEDVGEEVVYFVWTGVTSTGVIYEGSETLGFKDVDGQARIIYHTMFLRRGLNSQVAATTKGAGRGAVAQADVELEGNVCSALYQGWVSENLESVMGLFTEESTMLEYTLGGSLRTISGLAEIRSWFEAELGTRADMAEGPELSAKPNELDAAAEVCVGEAQSETLQFAMNLVSLDGATIAHFHLLRNNLGGGNSEFVT